MHDATALNETRTLSFHHTHSNEDLTVTFKRDGRYDEEALKKLNHFLRDWRSQDQTTMDRHLFDILWEVYRDVDGKQPIQIISAYRSPATNAMLRRRSSGVARFSQHMLGHAMDFFIPGVPLEQIRAAGLRLQRGGVGFYPTSGSPFVHLDTGSVRHWPRMTHDQLARVFPDGRTVHLPSNGGPLKGYELARADIERRGSGDDAATVGKKPSLFASLFKGGKSNDEDDEGGAPVTVKNEKPAPSVVAAAAAPKAAEIVPTPRAKPVAATIQLASADAQIVPAPKSKTGGIQDRRPSRPRRPPPTSQPSRNRRHPPTSSTPAASGAMRRRRPISPPPCRSRPSGPARPSAPPIRSRLPAFPRPSTRRWPTRRPPPRRLTAPTSSPPPRRSRAPCGRRATPPLPPPKSTPSSPRGAQGQGSVISTSTRLAAAKGNDVWMRVVMLAPSASNAMSTTVLGDTDMTLMRSYFVKPPFDDHDGLLGRSDDGHDHRPVYRIGDRQARHAVFRACARRRCAKRAQPPLISISSSRARGLNAVLTRVCASLRQAGKPALSRPAS